MISAIYQWEMKNVWISEGVILGICTFVDLILGSFEVSFLKYVVIGEIGIGLIVICFAMCWDDNKAIAFTGLILITICCIMSGLIIGLIGNNGLKYVLVFGIGSYIVLVVFVITVLFGNDMAVVWLLSVSIVVMCVLSCLIIDSIKTTYLKYISIGVIGFILIVICFNKFGSSKIELAVTGMILIIISCILTGLIIGLIGKNGLKYALIFGIGSYIVLIIYLLGIIDKRKWKEVWINGGIILEICINISLVVASFEVWYMKYLAIATIGLCLIQIILITEKERNLSEKTYTGAVLVIVNCIFAGLIFGFTGTILFKYILVFGIGSFITFLTYLIIRICNWEVEYVYICGCITFGICILAYMILWSLINSVVRVITIIIFCIVAIIAIITASMIL